MALILSISSSSVFAQLGPGGVSHETPNTLNPTQSDLRIWLDAGTLIDLADGDEVLQWNDISHSTVNDKATAHTAGGYVAPIFRDDASAAINGFPVVTFDEGSVLKVESSTDLNTASTTSYEQTMIFAFRTSEDIASRQILWEEGGSVRGLNAFIFEGEVHLGVYDLNEDRDVNWNKATTNGKVPEFGYNYVKHPIQPNTTYVLSHIFSAPTNNTLTGYVKGYQNGSYFGTLINGGPGAAGVGGIFKHPDPIGIGAINKGSYNEQGIINNKTGQYPFKGRLAEICYYSRLLNDGERIIVENYLGAKYYANIIVNDRYMHKANYGHDVIGIGQTNDISTRHTTSQGRNPFEISPFNSNITFGSGSDKFLLTGHNGQSMNFTDENVPNDPGSTMRTHRVWRFDANGKDFSRVKFRFHSSNLPPLPDGYSKHVLIFDNSSQHFPNFSTSNATVYELAAVSGGYYDYEVTVDMKYSDGAFMAIGALKPRVSFSTAESYAIEGNPPQDSTLYFNKVFARLNYVPTSPVKAYYSFTDNTAFRATDYGYSNTVVANGINFPPGQQERPIFVYVKNDIIQEDPSTESFFINLEIDPPNTTPGLGLGEISQHTFTIYDDDPPPKLGFAQATGQALESAGAHEIKIVRSGTTVGTASAKVQINYGSITTATLDTDFNFPAFKTVNFIDGQSEASFTIDIIDDELDEDSEFIRFQLYDIVGAGVDASAIHHTLEIVDNDNPPNVEFLSEYSQNYKTNGNPLILVVLDKPSSKTITVNFTKTETLSSAATYGMNYGLAFPGIVVISPGDTLAHIPGFTVDQDGFLAGDTDDKTVEFEITGATNANSSPSSNYRHIYTIKDYSVFEFKGVAGVGKNTDNVFWLDINRQSGDHNSSLQNITNFTPHNILISQNTVSRRAELQTTSNLINGRKTLWFNHNQNSHYTIKSNGLINTAPYVGNKSYFMVIKTGADVNGWQTIYKQGGASRGLAIYIHDGSLYFNAWNNIEENGQPDWGTGSSSGSRFAKFDNLLPDSDYIIACLFDKDAPEKLRIYVNGIPGQRAETETCGNIFAHTGAVSIGGASGTIKYHNGNTSNHRYFKGFLAEFVHFHEAPVNETRRIILENYLSGKYNIPLEAGMQRVALNTEYQHEIAGIGQLSEALSDVHTDSQGPGAMVRIKTPETIGNSTFAFWGHNNVPLSETWPWSNASLPTGILERSGRVWRMSKSGNIDGFNLSLSFSSLQNKASFSQTDLKLLVHTNPDGQDFTGAQVVPLTSIKSGYIAYIQSVSIPDGAFFALANRSSIVPLPIKLLEFTATKNENAVDLKWITASEQNNAFFEIERAGSDLKFERILKTPGAGNSNTTLFYSEKDKNPLSGMNYYRLKQTDYDGAYEYSDVVSVHFSDTKNAEIDFIIYPNPADKRQEITIASTSNITNQEEFNLSIRDNRGALVLSKKYSSKNTITTIDLPQTLSPGMYFISIGNSNIQKTHKLIVQ